MKTILACRPSCTGRFVANRLAEAGLLDGLILESGAIARRRKLERMKRGKGWLGIARVYIDAAALMVYGRWFEHRLARSSTAPRGWNDFPPGLPRIEVADINETRSRDFLREQGCEVLVVLGTGILGQATLAVPSRFVLNIHGGRVPAYRNVHCDFWAFRRRDFENIGSAILYLDRGIDSGDVAIQESISWQPGDGLFEIKQKNLQLSGELIERAIRQAEQGTLPRARQEAEEAGFHPTPGLFDLLWALVHG